jgi:hypothetical protein
MSNTYTSQIPNNMKRLPFLGGFRTYHLPNMVCSCELVTETTHFTWLSHMMVIYAFSLAFKIGDERRRDLYNGFNIDTLGHSNAWVKVADKFVVHAFVGEPHVVKCPCSRCQNLI